MHQKSANNQNSNHIAELANTHLEWLDTRPYRNDLLNILMDNGIEDEGDAHAVADAIIDLIEPAQKTPEELVIRMAHYAGELEARGEIAAPEWDELYDAIQAATKLYYNHPSETNPFYVEDVVDQVLLDRFPAQREDLSMTIQNVQGRVSAQRSSTQTSPVR